MRACRQASGLESRKCFRFSLIYGSADSASNGPSHHNRPHTISSIPKKVTHPLTHLTQPHTTSRSWNSKQKGLLIIVMATFPLSSSCASTNYPIILTLFQPLIILLPRYLRCSFSLCLSLGCPPPLLPLHFFSTM